MSHKVERTEVVSFSCGQMFDLVNDIETYPDYMDGCQSATILSRGDDWIEAKLTLGLGSFVQSFSTRNQLAPPHEMTMKLVGGPFSQLEGAWTFLEESDGCKVTLALTFDLKNPLIGYAAGKMLEQMAESQVKSLCRRAQQIYS